MLSYVSFPLSSTLSSLIAGEYDIIFTLSPPLWLGLSAYLIGKAKGTPFIYNVQDLFPEAAIKLGVLRNEYAINFFEKLERFVYTKAKCVPVICDSFRDNIVKKGIPTRKVVVIPNWVDTDFIHPMEKNNEFRKENDIGDRFVILYSGAIGFSQPLEIVLECAKFMANNPEILFVIVGSGVKKEQLQERAEQMSLKNIRFFDSQPRSKLPALLASADVSLVMLKPGVATVSLPSKIYGIMASGRPIIASLDKNSDAWNIIKEANCGVLVEPENFEQLATAISLLYCNQELCLKYGENGRKYVVENNSRKKITAEYGQLLKSLI
jgi:colanic acid biosynthesis glycosyl transferase WcaI